MKQILLSIILTFSIYVIYGQGKFHGGGGSTSSSNTTSPSTPSPISQSGSTQIQQGFHYKMKIRGHIQYHNQNDSTDRYWDKSKRLRVSINQDSGKLSVNFLENNFPESSNIDTLKGKKGDYKKDKYGNYIIAKPISGSDLVDSFYLSINRRKLAKDITYYRSIHYVVNQYGATTIPFVFRPKYKTKTLTKTDTKVSSSSSANLSLAVYLGRKWGWTRFFYDPNRTHNTASVMASLFGGVQSLSLSSSNTFDGKSSSPLAVSTGVSLTIELNIVNFGLFVGHDFTFGNANNWIYNKQPLWFGFGVGFNLGMMAASGTLQL